jgi:hypothetical protein
MPVYPGNVEQHHKLQYAASVEMVAQQLKNPLLPAVTIVPASGEAQSVRDLVGKVDYVRGTARNRSNTENPVSGSRRWVVYDPTNEIKSGQYIETEDKFRTATDPTSVFVKAHTGAVTRGQMDQLLGIEKVGADFTVTRGGIYGLAREGKTPNSVGTALPAGQYLPDDANGLTLDKLIEAVELLQLADFGIDNDLDPLFGLITPRQKSDLLRIAAATNANLNAFDVKQLESGKPTMLMGVNWIMTNRVPRSATGKRMIAIWSKANIIGGEWEPINGKMWNDTHADDLPYVRVRTNLDAVRGEDAGVVVIPCTE